MKEYIINTDNNKLLFNIINPETQEQEGYIFLKSEVRLFVEDSDLYFEFKGKKYQTIDNAHDYIKMNWIKEIQNETM